MDKLTRATHEYNLSLWTGRINECRRSGLTVAKWCEQNTLALADSNLPVFSKIDLAVDQPLESGASVTIRLHDISIELRDGATESVIRNALLAIRSIC